MGEYITEELIVNEYLNNLFIEDDLADYLCINVSDVRKALNNVKDEKLKSKIEKHKHIITLYYLKINGVLEDNTGIEDSKYRDIVLYIVNNHCSIRECAKASGLGKTTIFDYIHEQLPYIDIILYKKVFDVLMENKSFSTDNKKVREQILECYDLLLDGYTIKEISKELNLGWNVVERNLNQRLGKIDQEKATYAGILLDNNRKEALKEHAFGK